MDVIVTTGGTSEPIDDVRAVTNFSTGRFGVNIAEAFARRSHNVTALASREAGLHCEAAGITHTRFGPAAELDELLRAALTPQRRCIAIHAAAVADYTPRRATGKLPSTADELTITMERTPKIVDSLRAAGGRKAFLVGFKLLSGVAPAELHAAAFALMKRAKLNLVVANDLSECRDGQHPVWLITQEGGVIRVEGDRAAVAERIVEFIVAREDVTWSATRIAGADEPVPQVPAEVEATMGDLLDFAAAANLLPGTDGNAVVRVDGPDASHLHQLFVTPRQVPKADVGPGDCIVATIDTVTNTVTAWPPPHTPGAKPSIDTSVQVRILEVHDDATAILHTHELWGRTDVTTEFPYPCGAAEEAAAVNDAARRAGINPSGFSVTLTHHGFLLVGNRDHFARLSAQWQASIDEFAAHLDDVTGSASVDGFELRPIVDGADIIGVCARNDDGVAVHIGAEHRGRGVGSTITAQLISRQQPVTTIDECGVIDHWSRRGFTPTRSQDGTVTLTPPPRTDDLPSAPSR